MNKRNVTHITRQNSCRITAVQGELFVISHFVCICFQSCATAKKAKPSPEKKKKPKSYSGLLLTAAGRQ